MLQMQERSPEEGKSLSLEIIDKLQRLRDHFNPRLDLTSTEITSLCQETRTILLSEPSLLRPTGSLVIAGDIHGQWTDLRTIFTRFGYPPSRRYLFLGDYVDRGYRGIEVLLMLFALKCAYPEHIYLLRGNHECPRVNRDYGFLEECRRRLGLQTYLPVYEAFVSVFSALPLAALVNQRVFCVHGGLSPHLHDLDQITAVRRPGGIPDHGLVHDLLWTDPAEDGDELDADGWGSSRQRGSASRVYGPAVIEGFLRDHGLSLVCRSHGFAAQGYRFHANQGLLTLFSAPDYCGAGNRAAVLLVDASSDARIHLFS